MDFSIQIWRRFFFYLICIVLKEFNDTDLSKLSVNFVEKELSSSVSFSVKFVEKELSSLVSLVLPLMIMSILPTKFSMTWVLYNLGHPFWVKLWETMIFGILSFHCHSLTVNKNTGESWWQQYQVENVTSASLEIKTDAASKCSGTETLKLNPTSNTIL